MLSKNYPDVASAVADMREYAQLADNALSVGLGAGDPNQSAMVSEISRQVQPQHVNQVFTGRRRQPCAAWAEPDRGQRSGVSDRHAGDG